LFCVFQGVKAWRVEQGIAKGAGGIYALGIKLDKWVRNEVVDDGIEKQWNKWSAEISASWKG